MDIPNYFTIKHFMPFFEEYCFFDTEDRSMKEIAIRNGAESFKYDRHYFVDEDGPGFVISIAKVRKKHHEQMEQALENLDTKLTLQYGNAYINTKREFFDFFEAKCKEKGSKFHCYNDETA